MKGFIKRRKLKYGSVAVVITVLTVVAVIMLNVIAAILANRYEWMYRNMTSEALYAISEDCENYIAEYVISEVDRVNGEDGQQKIKIIFCNEKETIRADESLRYIHDSVYEIMDMFPEYMETEYINVWENPSLARKYGVTSTGDVICEFNGRYETMNFADFYIFDPADMENAVAYNGEKIIASCLMRVTQENTPVCYFTANHGEEFSDTTLMRTIVEAGYTVKFVDLSKSDIPDECDLLITFAPKQDMAVSDGVSGVSEIDRLDAYMARGGKYIVFLSADSFSSGSRDNFEGFLAEWGVKYMHRTSSDGVENAYVVKDNTNSLTVNGYTVLSQNASSGRGADALSGTSYPNAFGNATTIEFADGFESDGNGNFVKNTPCGVREVSAVLTSYPEAEAYAGGMAVARADKDPFVLMSMSYQKQTDGTESYLIALSSTEFAENELMQSAVLGNSRTLTEIIRYMGKDNAPSQLVFKPFESAGIESLTVSAANTITAVLAATPAVVLATLGLIVLIKRRSL